MLCKCQQQVPYDMQVYVKTTMCMHYQCFGSIQQNDWDYFTHLPRLMKHLSVRRGKMESGREDEAVSSPSLSLGPTNSFWPPNSADPSQPEIQFKEKMKVGRRGGIYLWVVACLLVNGCSAQVSQRREFSELSYDRKEEKLHQRYCGWSQIFSLPTVVFLILHFKFQSNFKLLNWLGLC